MANTVVFDFELWSVQDYLDFTNKMGRGEIVEAAEVAWKSVVTWNDNPVKHKQEEDVEKIVDELEIYELASLSKAIQSEIVSMFASTTAVPGYETNVGGWKSKQLRAFQKSLKRNNQEELFDMLDTVIVSIPEVEGTPRVRDVNFEQFIYILNTVNAGIKEKFNEGN